MSNLTLGGGGPLKCAAKISAIHPFYIFVYINVNKKQRSFIFSMPLTPRWRLDDSSFNSRQNRSFPTLGTGCRGTGESLGWGGVKETLGSDGEHFSPGVIYQQVPPPGRTWHCWTTLPKRGRAHLWNNKKSRQVSVKGAHWQGGMTFTIIFTESTGPHFTLYFLLNLSACVWIDTLKKL